MKLWVYHIMLPMVLVVSWEVKIAMLKLHLAVLLLKMTRYWHKIWACERICLGIMLLNPHQRPRSIKRDHQSHQEYLFILPKLLLFQWCKHYLRGLLWRGIFCFVTGSWVQQFHNFVMCCFLLGHAMIDGDLPGHNGVLVCWKW